MKSYRNVIARLSRKNIWNLVLTEVIEMFCEKRKMGRNAPDLKHQGGTKNEMQNVMAVLTFIETAAAIQN